MNNKKQNIEPSNQNFRSSELVAACIDAIEEGNTAALGQIFTTAERANWQLPKCPRYDLLIHAVIHRDYGVVDLLLERGANPNVVFCDGTRETCGDRIDSTGNVAMQAAAEKWLLQQEVSDDEVDERSRRL